MKIKFLSIVSFVAAGFLFMGAVNASPAPEQAKKDGEILEVLIVANTNEIATANEALKKSSTPAVKEYANMLKTQHEKNLIETMKVAKTTGIAPVKTTLSAEMKKNGAKELHQLKSLNNKEFDKAYIQAMVKGHIMVIEIMDTNLLKNVSNEALKNHLVATRPHLEAHLKQAQAIEKTEN